MRSLSAAIVIIAVSSVVIYGQAPEQTIKIFGRLERATLWEGEDVWVSVTLAVTKSRTLRNPAFVNGKDYVYFEVLNGEKPVPFAGIVGLVAITEKAIEPDKPLSVGPTNLKWLYNLKQEGEFKIRAIYRDPISMETVKSEAMTLTIRRPKREIAIDSFQIEAGPKIELVEVEHEKEKALLVRESRGQDVFGRTATLSLAIEQLKGAKIVDVKDSTRFRGILVKTATTGFLINLDLYGPQVKVETLSAIPGEPLQIADDGSWKFK